MSEDINESIINFKIISEVEKRPCLWESEYANLEGTDIVTRAWDEVAYAVNLESSVVKSSWLIIYNKLVYKLKNRYKKDEEYFEDLLSWPYFQAMKFLTKTIEDILFNKLSDNLFSPRRISNDENLLDIKSSPASTIINEDVDNDGLDEAESDLNQYSYRDDDLGFEDTAGSDGDVTIVDDHDMNINSKDKLPPCPESDYLYLMMLLPLFGKLPDKRKLKVRIKIQEILYKEIYGCNT